MGGLGSLFSSPRQWLRKNSDPAGPCLQLEVRARDKVVSHFPKRSSHPQGGSPCCAVTWVPPTPPPDQYGGTFQEWGSRPDPLLTSPSPARPGCDDAVGIAEGEGREREKKNKYSKRS